MERRSIAADARCRNDASFRFPVIALLAILFFSVAPAWSLVPLTHSVSVASGGSHGCALIDDASARCWGWNFYGQLGDGTTTDRLTAVRVAGLAGNATALITGFGHTCALIANGTVQCWGDGTRNQIGNGQSVQQIAPVTVTGLVGVVAIASGGYHSCALIAGGSIRCWGSNNFGQLGNGNAAPQTTPVGVAGLAGPAIAIAAGGDLSCALISGGTVQCWGYNNDGQVGNGTTSLQQLTPATASGIAGAIAVATSGGNVCALLSGGTIRCWGYNSSGQLGDGTTTSRTTSVPVTGLGGTAIALAVSGAHACATMTGGVLRCWGANNYGQLGDGTTNPSSTPVSVAGLAGTPGPVSLGGLNTCAVVGIGTVQCWGRNAQGQLGNGLASQYNVPVTMLGLSGTATAVTGGDSSTCVAISGGTVQCTGLNADGQLGDGTTGNRSSPVTVANAGGSITKVDAGFYHTCAILASGVLRCWGNNTNGQLGIGSTTSQAAPTNVSGLAGTAISIAGGYGHTCAVISGGAVQCWGLGQQGQLGNGLTAQQTGPVNVTGLSGPVASVYAGNSHSCALLVSGGIQCWGFNSMGEMGNGTTTSPQLTPATVTGLAGAVTALSVGSFHACAVISGGVVQCWGDNALGQLGTGDKTPRSTPVTVNGLAGPAVGVATGNGHSCVVINTGAVQCWGHNFYGQVGDGTSVQRLTPVTVSGLTGATAITAGYVHVCALIANGTVKCWGNDSVGQLGNGVSETFTTPQTVLQNALDLTPATFPGGALGIVYPSQTLVATGGTAPYTFAVTSGALPPGLGLGSGAINGTPTSPGTFSFAITGTDSTTSGPVLTGTRAYSITVTGTLATLTVAKTGSGTGSVTSAPAGIDCGSDCSEGYAPGTPVTLSVIASPGSTFVGWLGACTGSGACNVTMSAARSVTAGFAPSQLALKYDLDGNNRSDALTDGLIILRGLFGTTGAGLIQNALASDATVVDAASVKQRFDNLGPILDVDGNGRLDALTDGLLIIRYLFGMRVPGLTTDAIASGATRSPSEIEAYIRAHSQ